MDLHIFNILNTSLFFLIFGYFENQVVTRVMLNEQKIEKKTYGSLVNPYLV